MAALAAAAEVSEERRRADEAGQSMVEYAFILILVAMVCIVLVAVIGHATNNLYSNVSSGLGT